MEKCNDNSYSEVLSEPSLRALIAEKAGELVELLSKLNYHISFAESCTAGLLSDSLASVSGASKVFEEGYVTYSDKAKVRMLGVSSDIIEVHTAVALETAKDMCEKLAFLSRAEVNISVTGYAGPRVKDEPVGLVYIGLNIKGETKVFECHFDGDRQEVRLKATLKAFSEAYLGLKNSEKL
ncbi:MAG: CinA family protein [Lachnospiraceae bacterium]|nr:CinA family protein [Lachnospiraceae bacterium]